MTKDALRESFLKRNLYTPSQPGIWHITGETIDYGDNDTFTPEIGFFSGTYEDIVDYALEHPHFISEQGFGGSISIILPKQIDRAFVDCVKATKETIQQLEGEIGEKEAWKNRLKEALKSMI